jgi:Protein of unknown function (DUF3099)
MQGVGRPDPVYRITAAQTPLSVEQRGRARRYLWSMGVRTACFLAAIVAHGWLRWVLVLAALVLPWVSVISANVGRERDRDDPVSTADTVTRLALGPTAAGRDRSDPDGSTNSVSGA